MRLSIRSTSPLLAATVVAIAVNTVMTLVYGNQPPAQPGQERNARVIRTRQLELTDKKGEPRVIIRAAPQGELAGMFVFHDKQQRAFVGIAADGGPTVELTGEAIKSLATIQMAAAAGDAPGLTLSSPSGDVVLATASDVVGMQLVHTGSPTRALLLAHAIEEQAIVGVTDNAGRAHGLNTDGDELAPRRQIRPATTSTRTGRRGWDVPPGQGRSPRPPRER